MRWWITGEHLGSRWTWDLAGRTLQVSRPLGKSEHDLSKVQAVLLMRHEGARAWKALNDAFTQGKVPTGELADAALILVGGVLLMLPGFLTDVLGFLFLLRWTRPVARKIIAFFVARRVNRLGIPVMRARLDTENLIEGESVEQPPANGRKQEGPVIIAGEIEEP